MTCFDPISSRKSVEIAAFQVFQDYLKLIAKTNETRYDVVLIDGRVRGECALEALAYVDERSVVIIHDWFLEERGYEFLANGCPPSKSSLKQLGFSLKC